LITLLSLWERRILHRSCQFHTNPQNLAAIDPIEKDTGAGMRPAVPFRDCVWHYDLWRGFAFDLLSERLSSVMATVEVVAFRCINERVTTFLSRRRSQDNSIQITHQEIAAEQESSREVFSRILEDFCSLEVISVSRRTIKVPNREALQTRSVVQHSH
jgi:CRP/FNR family transcriptional regulator